MPYPSRNYPVLIGSVGWRHPAWCATYYPADLPAEWQLGYYANEFPVVLVPAGETLDEAVDSEELDLQLVFELSAATAGEACRQRAALPAAGARSVLLHSTPGQAPEALAPVLEALADEPLVVDFGAAEPGPGLQTLLSARQIGWCWHGGEDAQGLATGTLGIARLEAEAATPLQLRCWLETCLAAADPERQLILLLEGQPPAVEILRQMQTILDLL